MTLQFQAIALCGLVDSRIDADNEARFATLPLAGLARREVFDFAGYRLDPHAHTLHHQGFSQHLEPLGFALLCYLIEHRDRVVTKRELLEALWPTRFVTENVVARCVMKVRSTFNAQRDAAPVIATVHRVGYRFVALLDTTHSHAEYSPRAIHPAGGGMPADVSLAG